MNPDLERLIHLQQLESSAEDIRRRLADHPRRLQTLDIRLEQARGVQTGAKQQLADSQTARRAIEKDLAVVQARLSKFKDQLMEVKTNREYQAMQKEIEVAQHEVRAFEDRILEHMLRSDDLTADVKRAEAALTEQEDAVTLERRALEHEAIELVDALSRTAAARQALVSQIDPRLLATFEQVARGRRGVGVAEAREGHCAICQVRLRPQVFNEIRRNDAIIQCDSCQRILYFVPPSPAAAAIPAGDRSTQA